MSDLLKRYGARAAIPEALPHPHVPAPGSPPKLPQTIFNLEKTGGDPGKGSSTRSRPRP